MSTKPRLGIQIQIAVVVLMVSLLFFVFAVYAQGKDRLEQVEIVRDSWGVAHVYAETNAGVFFGAGFATAQDRMLQMELFRRAVQGRLAEILGPDWLEHDIRTRTLGLYRHAQLIVEHLAPDTREALEAYAAGVNHCLQNDNENMAAVFAKRGWVPEPWTAADSIAVWMRLSEFFDRSWQNEVHALRIYQAGTQRGESKVPVIDNEAAVVEEEDFARTNPAVYRRLKAKAKETVTYVPGFEGIKASHAWAVDGSRTTTGKPLLESDPQIAVTLPSLWYEIHLHGGDYNTRGIGVAGAPGFLIGWNEHLAWGATALGSDNADLFLERIDPTGKYYEYKGEWYPLEIRTEEIKVLGSKPVSIEVRETNHGPLVDDLLPNRRPDEHFALHYVVTQELHTSIEGQLAMMQAADWESFFDGVSRYHSPGLHIVYADVYGNIGYHTAAAIPIRTGTYGLPQIGWTGEEEWAGYVPFDELPQSLNPERGFIASGNHLPVGDWYPHNLTVASPGHTPRSWRLYELLSEGSGFSVKSFEEEVHRDNISPVARDFVALANLLATRNLLTPDAMRILYSFTSWDGRMIEGDPQSTLAQTLLAAIHRSLGSIPGTEDLAARFGGGYPGIIHLFRVVLADHETTGSSVWDEDVAVWINAILAQIGPQRGRAGGTDMVRNTRPDTEPDTQRDPEPPTPRSPEVDTEPGSRLDTRVGTERGTVRNSTPSTPSQKTGQQRVMLYQTNLEGFGSLDPSADRIIPELTTTFVDTIWSQLGNSYTHIVDLSNIDNSRAVLPPGISENPQSPHYFDQVDLWAQGATRPAPLSREAVMRYAESVQVLEYDRDNFRLDGTVPSLDVSRMTISTERLGTINRRLDKVVGSRAAGETGGSTNLALLEPPDGYVYHGTSPYAKDVDAYIAALGEPSLYPAVEGIHLAVPGTRPQSLELMVKSFLERVSATGRIPHLSFSMSIGDGEAVDDVIALTDTYDELIRAVGRIIRDYGDPVFVRIGFEFNGAWNRYHSGLYPIAFRKFVDLLREEGAHNIATIWCYEPNSPGDFDAVGQDGEPLWYPGDDYVDWFGLDLFYHSYFVPDANLSRTVLGADAAGRLSQDGNRTGSRLFELQYERSTRFLEMARRHGKPVMLSEVAAVDAHLTPDSDDPGFADGRGDWEFWFEPFFAFLAQHPEIKGFIYMSQDYRGTRYENNGWGDSRIQINSYILEQWIEALRDERFIHAK